MHKHKKNHAKYSHTHHHKRTPHHGKRPASRMGRVIFSAAALFGVVMIFALHGGAFLRASAIGTFASTCDTYIRQGDVASGAYTISGSGYYCVSGDISLNGANAIVIDANNITLDIGGNTLSNGDANAFPIAVQTQQGRARTVNFTVTNGTIQGFNVGVHVRAGTNITISNVTFQSNRNPAILQNVVNLDVNGNTINGGVDGIAVIDSPNAHIRNNSIERAERAFVLHDTSSQGASPTAILENNSTCKVHKQILYQADGRSPPNGKGFTKKNRWLITHEC